MNTQLLELASRLCQPSGRSSAANEIARHFGAEALIVFVKDGHTRRHRPASGFSQRLPGSASWRALLRRADESLDPISSDAPFPDEHSRVAALAMRQGSCIFVFLGASSPMSNPELEPLLALWGSLFSTEVALEDARAREHAAVDASKHAKKLAAALDAARVDVAAGAIQLRELNLELERRVIEEVDRRNVAEAALSQAQKLEAIGQLTGGVAHDFNNLLTIIVGGLDTIDRQLKTMDGSPQTARISRAQMMAQQAAQRAATLTARLLAFSRRQPLDPKSIDVDRVISGMIEMLRSTLGESIRVEAVAAAGLWRAMVDLPELEHAILNLAVNARDAMPDGGKLTIETGNIYLDETYVSGLAEPVPPGQYVSVAISDNGCGMDQETLDRVFEPFFTTKDVGKGTGLGLSQVYGFVRQTGGHVRIYSEPGHGTTVRICLPRVSVDLSDETEPLPSLEAGLLGGDETILVVEDHADLRAYSSGVLTELGYRVLEAENARQALEQLTANGPVDLLFTDVVLPDGVNGRKLADQAVDIEPKLKILFTTGYTRNAIVHHGRLDAGVQLLPKPFTFRALAEKVRRVLDE